MTTANAIVPRVRESRNTKFANDGSYDSVEALLRKLAAKCHARVMAMGLPMEFNDVFQEMNLSYVRAKNSWNPEGGAIFSTYCTTACLNNFNAAIKKMERDRKELGMSSIDGFAESVGDASDHHGSPHDYLINSAAEYIDSPEYRLERAQQVQSNLSNLSITARRLVASLLEADRRNQTNYPPRLRDIARQCQLDGKELQRVKLEILAKFGVRWL